MSERPKRRARGGEDRSEWPMKALLPPNNRPAGRSYVCALWGLAPVLGLILGPLALTLGIVGLWRYSRDPEAKGEGHSIVGLFLGSMELTANAAGLWFIARGLGWL